MATGGNPQTVQNVNGYTAPIGNRALAVRRLVWPDIANYLSGVGFNIGRQSLGLRGIDAAFAGISESGAYIVYALVGGPASSGVQFLLYDATDGTPIANHASVTADAVMICAIGG